MYIFDNERERQRERKRKRTERQGYIEAEKQRENGKR
jgi:hypothetical protein